MGQPWLQRLLVGRYSPDLIWNVYSHPMTYLLIRSLSHSLILPHTLPYSLTPYLPPSLFPHSLPPSPTPSITNIFLVGLCIVKRYMYLSYIFSMINLSFSRSMQCQNAWNWNSLKRQEEVFEKTLLQSSGYNTLGCLFSLYRPCSLHY